MFRKMNWGRKPVSLTRTQASTQQLQLGVAALGRAGREGSRGLVCPQHILQTLGRLQQVQHHRPRGGPGLLVAGTGGAGQCEGPQDGTEDIGKPSPLGDR